MFKLIFLTAAAIFTAEALIMLFLESFGEQLSLTMRVLLDSTLLMICVFPTLYFLIFKEMAEQIRLRIQAEQVQNDWNVSLERSVEERTERLQRANEDLLVEVQERAKSSMAMRTALNETRKGKEQLYDIINAVHDALVVVDKQWCVRVVNSAAETMFRTALYDLKGSSLIEFLTPLSQSPAALEAFFSRQQNEPQTFLMPPGNVDDKRILVQMRFGAELEWEGRPATVLMFYYRDDLQTDSPKPAGSD